MDSLEPVFWIYLVFLVFYFGISLRRTVEGWKDLDGWRSIGIWSTILLAQAGFIGGFVYLFYLTL